MLISAAEAAIRMGLTKRRILQLILEKRLKARRIGAAYVINSVDLNHILKSYERREMPEEEVRKKLEFAKELGEPTVKSLCCAMIGHSRIVVARAGKAFCGRCGAGVGPVVLPDDVVDDRVFVGHNCATCRENNEDMTWKDTLMAPFPFPLIV